MSKKVSWNDRDKATNPQEAIEALADLFSSSNGISGALNASNEEAIKSQMARILEVARSGDEKRLMSVVRSVANDFDEAEAFAAKWGIPFSRDLFISTFQKLNSRHDDDEGYWTSSSYSC
jgi:hypothetical protein